MTPPRRLAVLALLALAACGQEPDAQRAPGDPGAAARDTAALPRDVVPAEQGRGAGGADDARAADAGRRRVDVRARLDLTGAPDGVVVEIDGQELAGVVLLPPGRRTLHVYADGLGVGTRDVELRTAEVTVPDFAWVPEALARRRARLARAHPEDHAVDAGLEWLATHRSSDGAWRAGAFAERCPEDARCEGAVGGVSAVETTGLALLPFLGAGENHESSEYRRVVRDGLDFLVRVQDAAGNLDAASRAHALGTLALTEICAWTDTVRFREPAQRAVDALLARRMRGRGWLAAGVPDAGATAWAACALASARSAGLRLPDGVEADVLADLTVFGDPGGAQVSARDGAALTLARMLLGSPADDAALASGVTRIAASPPAADRPVDPEWAWFAMAVVFRTGGDVWRRWDAALRDGFLQRVEHPAPLFAHGPAGGLGEPARRLGRVRAAAFAQLVSEIHYRYGRVFGVTER